jgi:uncharacterized membrane protein HdeD (DUF308 family)
MQNLGPSLEMEELQEAGRHWGLLMSVGILLIVSGCVAIASPVIASGASVLLLALLMVVGGLAAIIGGISHRSNGGMAFYVLTGLLAIVVGWWMFKNPVEGLVGLTLMIGVWLLVSGIFRIVAAFTSDHGRGWLIFGGAISALLGAMLVFNLYTAVWFLGLAVGIEMIFLGWSWLAVGMAAKQARKMATTAA